MNGVPYWFIFWSGFWIIGIAAAVWGGASAHASKMKALDILRMYAERGIEPPAMLAEHLTAPKQAQHQGGWKHPSGRAHHLGSFVFSLFMCGAASGVAWWWDRADKSPEWVFYAAAIAATAFAAGGLGHLIAAGFAKDERPPTLPPPAA
jgi:hypothetical protein